MPPSNPLGDGAARSDYYGVPNRRDADVPDRWDLLAPDRLGSMLPEDGEVDLWFLPDLQEAAGKPRANRPDIRPSSRSASACQRPGPTLCPAATA